MKTYEITAGTPKEELELAQRELSIDLAIEDLTPRMKERGQRTLALIAFELSQQETERDE